MPYTPKGCRRCKECGKLLNKGERHVHKPGYTKPAKVKVRHVNPSKLKTAASPDSIKRCSVDTGLFVGAIEKSFKKGKQPDSVELSVCYCCRETFRRAVSDNPVEYCPVCIKLTKEERESKKTKLDAKRRIC